MILLAILLGITILAYYVMRYVRGQRVTLFANIKTIERTQGFKVFHISAIILIVKMVMIILLYLVATNALQITVQKPLTNTDYILVIDDSSSMAKTDYKPNRLVSAKEISERWIGVVPNSSQIGLVAFSEGIDTSIPLTINKQPLIQAINKININYSKSGTDLDFALSTAIQYLKDSQENKTILLFTDGTQTVTNSTIGKAVSNNIRIVTFGIGDASQIEDDSAVPKDYLETFNTLDFNFKILKDIAKRTGANAYKVSNKEELEQSFNQATLKETQVKLNSGYYIALLIAIISILELVVYGRLGAL